MELQKLLQDEIREGLYRITISGPRGDSEVSKVRIRPVEIKRKTALSVPGDCRHEGVS